MVGIARKDDRTDGTCFHPSHDPPLSTGGTITTGSSSVSLNGKPIARKGDTVVADCGHSSEITSGSQSVTSAGLGEDIARLNDAVGNGPYIASITSASTTVSTL